MAGLLPSARWEKVAGWRRQEEGVWLCERVHGYVCVYFEVSGPL